MSSVPPRGDNIPSDVVAFTAKLAISDSYPTHSGTLRFTNVLLNEGDAYSSESGAFTCRVDGVYHFAVHASIYGRAQCAIKKNGETVVSLYHTSLPDKCSQVASTSCVMRLSREDVVTVDVWGCGRNDIFATEDNDTVFVGFKLGNVAI